VLLAEFNAMPAAEAAGLVRPCADIGSWVDAVVAARPYADLESLLDHADARAREWSDVEVERALADHPRIGERPRGTGRSARLSRDEQAGVDGQDTGLRERLAAGNATYEERFGRIFLVRAAGRSTEEILALLEERLDNDPQTELAVTAGQLREIAVLRLKGLFA
jgi:2-oxo-4-hydroxy-4-carboxy-5-ureidoimidazoline decarboxylase